jgi:hypothetical protein
MAAPHDGSGIVGHAGVAAGGIGRASPAPVRAVCGRVPVRKPAVAPRRFELRRPSPIRAPRPRPRASCTSGPCP